MEKINKAENDCCNAMILRNAEIQTVSEAFGVDACSIARLTCNCDDMLTKLFEYAVRKQSGSEEYCLCNNCIHNPSNDVQQ
ncbi:MAG TPA: hypothetical protein VK179_19470 [Bacteroidales bacterium]|nr:hypothetical protein [Bacteroidales bacterium]